MLLCNIYCTFVSKYCISGGQNGTESFCRMSHKSPKKTTDFQRHKRNRREKVIQGSKLKEFTLYCQTIKYLFIRFPTLFYFLLFNQHFMAPSGYQTKKMQKDFLLFLAVIFFLLLYLPSFAEI